MLTLVSLCVSMVIVFLCGSMFTHVAMCLSLCGFMLIVLLCVSMMIVLLCGSLLIAGVAMLMHVAVLTHVDYCVDVC